MKLLNRVDTRSKLEPRRDPYWYRLSEGRHLGYRRMTKGSAGSWLARAYADGGYVYHRLGDFSAQPEGEQFDAAKLKAEEWFDQLDMGVSPTSSTVRDACQRYVSEKRLESEAAANAIATRFALLVDEDPLAKVELPKLRPVHIAGWKKRVLALGNSHGTFNRDATNLRAALNLARRRLEVANDLAWREELKPFENADGRRTLYLKPADRRKLLEKCSDEARPFFHTLALLPLRPGDAAALRVSDLDVRNKVLRVPAGKGKPPRSVPLPDEAMNHLKACAEGKLPTAWLLSRADGGQWKKEAWRDEIKLAAAGAKLPKATVAYSIRHSTITDLVTGGLDLFHVATLAGTSVLMVQKHYGQLQAEHARAALKKLSLAGAAK
jgi:integrase